MSLAWISRWYLYFLDLESAYNSPISSIFLLFSRLHVRMSVWSPHPQRCQTLQVWSLTLIQRFVVIYRLWKVSRARLRNFCFAFFLVEVEFCSRARASFMPTCNITFTIPGGYVGERACSIRVNWTRLTQTDKVNVNSFGIYVSEYRKVIASSFKSIFLSMSHLLQFRYDSSEQ